MGKAKQEILSPYSQQKEDSDYILLDEVLQKLDMAGTTLPEMVEIGGVAFPSNELKAIVTQYLHCHQVCESDIFADFPLKNIANEILEKYYFSTQEAAKADTNFAAEQMGRMDDRMQLELALSYQACKVPFPSPEQTKFTFIDLFAGIGGFRIAMQKAGGKCVFSSEFDKDAQRTYFANYGEVPYGDITKINEKIIPNHDVLCGGFPCQPFSISGKRLGFEDTRGTLFFDIVRIAKEKRPKVLFLENVKNLLSHNNGETVRQMMDLLDDIGYDAQIQLLNAARYGVPQRRERVYIIALRKDISHKKFVYPSPLDIPIHIENIVDADPQAVATATIHRNDVEFWDNDGHEEYALSPVRIGTVNKGGQGERIYSPKGVGVTLSAYGGGAGAKTGLYKIDGKVRRLTPRECARLQGFPEEFVIPSNRNIAYKQFGNSVSINVLSCIANSILKTEILK